MASRSAWSAPGSFSTSAILRRVLTAPSAGEKGPAAASATQDAPIRTLRRVVIHSPQATVAAAHRLPDFAACPSRASPGSVSLIGTLSVHFGRDLTETRLDPITRQ